MYYRRGSRIKDGRPLISIRFAQWRIDAKKVDLWAPPFPHSKEPTHNALRAGPMGRAPAGPRGQLDQSARSKMAPGANY